jgi:hypothetical protein
MNGNKGATSADLTALTTRLHDGEPVFYIRAQDVFGPSAVAAYAVLIESATGITQDVTRDHLHQAALDCAEIANRMRDWQRANPDKVKIPD